VAERHDAQGWWQAEAGAVEPLAPLDGDLDADVVIVGGGYTGMWSAWFAKLLEPEADVVLLEREVCGSGPSGRNGGFVNEMWFSLPTLRERFGDAPALVLARASTEAVAGVGRWCEDQGVDAWFRPGGYLQVSTTPAHDDATDEILAIASELGEAGAIVPQTAEQIAARCASPVFRGGAFFPGAATVQPARLAHGLRDRLVAGGVRVCERSPMRRIRERSDGVEIQTDSGSVRARAAVLAAGPWLARLRPVRRHMTLTTSHMLITEPVPDLLEEIGWTGGECITDSRVMLHYFRTTPDGRIAFGWGGGPVVPGTRLGHRADVTPGVVAEIERHLVRFFPGLEGRRVEHAWGGPIDVSPSHVPSVVSFPSGRAFAAFGYTGNGVGPTHLFGQILARLALERRDGLTALPIVDPPPSWRVPPEPFRYAGGKVIRRALIRKEEAEELGREPGPVTSFVADFPHRIGIHVGR
jgi:glycine/D-amino acid oxidase-like deaminating enzyme